MEINIQESPHLENPVAGEIHVWKAFSFNNKNLFGTFKENRNNQLSLTNQNGVISPSRRVVSAIAAKYMDCKSSDIQFQVNKEGKPSIRDIDSLEFNLSHCGNDLVVVFACEPVGFDMECKDRKADFTGLARRFFSPTETIEIEKHGGELFLRWWTAKEAMLKLLGCGIQGGLANAKVLSSGGGVVCGEQVCLREFEWSKHYAHLATWREVQEVREFEIMG